MAMATLERLVGGFYVQAAQLTAATVTRHAEWARMGRWRCIWPSPIR